MLSDYCFHTTYNFFLLLSNIITSSAMVNLTKSSNNIAFMFIFLFTLYQSHQFKSHIYNDDDGDSGIKGVKILMAIKYSLL
jgi:hypothetical protein